MNKESKRSQGFSVVELTVAISVISILAILFYSNYQGSLRTTRDANRKSSATSLSQAIGLYSTTNGTSFIQKAAATGEKDPCVIPTGRQDDASVQALGIGCVGASGRAYGKANLKSVTVAGAQSGATQSRQYAGVSIVEALQSHKLLNTAVTDPQNAANSAPNAAQKDFVVIRACPLPNGVQKTLQYVGSTGGSVVAVWTRLEGNVSSIERNNRTRFPGDFRAKPVGVTWDYDLAVNSLQEYNEFQTNGFAVSNNALILSEDDQQSGPIAQSCTSENTPS
jgi:prepilin-type N-terminal cleavage/methylation domain-containing protein